MRAQIFAAGLTAVVCIGVTVSAQPTPTPVDSNIAVTEYAQNHGRDLNGAVCSTRGDTGCGGCYPGKILDLSDPTSALSLVNPEWAPIGPMLPAADTSLPPDSEPVLLTGTVVSSRINEGGDFPASHLTNDQNTLINVDLNSLLGTGNDPPGCAGSRCNTVELEWEIGKYPLFAWAGEGDRIAALGRWIFDCGHSDANPLGGCSNDASQGCNVDADCAFPGTCNNPPANFNYRAELHPPQAVAVIRQSKSPARTRAVQADVYVSNDGGGAGDRCTVTHLANPVSALFDKSCFQNHCSVTTSRSCKVNKDCAHGESCIALDPNGRLASIARDFEFDIPLPTPPPGDSNISIRTKSFKPKGGIMPAPIFQVTPGPTPNVHVIIPMSVPVKGKQPNVFAGRISAGWTSDTTPLQHVQVKFRNLTIHHPLKPNSPALARQCTDPINGGLTGVACTTDAGCSPAGSCQNDTNTGSGSSCHVDNDCPKKEFCKDGAQCFGGHVPGWELWAEVNGDWIQFEKLGTVGAVAPFATTPYLKPTPAVTLPERFKFDAYLPAGGSIHIATTGHSLACLDIAYGLNLNTALTKYGVTASANCALDFSKDVGGLELTHSGSDFSTVTNSSGVSVCIPYFGGRGLLCTATSGGGDAGICSVTNDRLCLTSADCPAAESCAIVGGAFTLQYTLEVL